MRRYHSVRARLDGDDWRAAMQHVPSYGNGKAPNGGACWDTRYKASRKGRSDPERKTLHTAPVDAETKPISF